MFATLLDKYYARLVRGELVSVNAGEWYTGDFVSSDVLSLTVHVHGSTVHCFAHTANSGECHYLLYTVRFGSRRRWYQAACSLQQGKFEEFLRRHGLDPLRVKG